MPFIFEKFVIILSVFKTVANDLTGASKKDSSSSFLISICEYVL